MISQTDSFILRTHGKGTYPITKEIKRFVGQAGIKDGVATVFVSHTSASLVIYENADPTAREDLHAYFEKIVPEDNPDYHHTLEGPDDTTSHLRMALTRTSEVIPIKAGVLCLGTWQGIYLFEHRREPHERTIWVNVMGQ